MALSTRLYVGNLPYEATEAEIAAFVEQQGKRKVTEVKIVLDRETGRPRGFAFIEVTKPDMVHSAIAELNGTQFGGRTIVVNEAKEPKTQASRAAMRRG